MYAPGVVSAETVPGRVAPMMPDRLEVKESGRKLDRLESGTLPSKPPAEALTIFPVAESYASAVPPTPKTPPSVPMI